MSNISPETLAADQERARELADGLPLLEFAASKFVQSKKCDENGDYISTIDERSEAAADFYVAARFGGWSTMADGAVEHIEENDEDVLTDQVAFAKRLEKVRGKFAEHTKAKEAEELRWRVEAAQEPVWMGGDSVNLPNLRNIYADTRYPVPQLEDQTWLKAKQNSTKDYTKPLINLTEIKKGNTNRGKNPY